MRRLSSYATATSIVTAALVLVNLSSISTSSASVTAARGSSANSTLTPVRIGYSNTDAGTALQFLAITQGAEAAAGYVNSKLGGIDHHPLQLVDCPVLETLQSNQACGEKFANDASIPMAVTGLTSAGGPLYSALAAAHKPVLGGIPIDATDYSAPSNTWFYYGGGVAAFTGFASYLIQHHLKKATFINADIVGGQAALATVKKALKGSGVQLTSTFLPPTSADVLPAIESSGATKDAAILINYQNCLPVAQALQTLGVHGKIIADDSCITPPLLAQNPTLFEGWIEPQFTQIAAAGPGLPDVNTFIANYTKYGQKVPPGDLSEAGWGSIITLAKILNKLGYAKLHDEKALLNAIKSYRGPVTMGQPHLSCPGSQPYPAVCTTSNTFYVIKNGKPVLVSKAG
jgi:branched-chain amino acid transport system substrate-binding protein